MCGIACPSHPKAELVADHRAGDLICSDCGLVVAERIIEVSSEWRSFKNGCSDTLTFNSFSQQSDKAAKPHLQETIGFVTEMCERLHLTGSIHCQAVKIYEKVADNKVLRGKNKEALAAACLFIACREQHVPRTFKEFTTVSTVSKKDLGRYFKLIIGLVDLDLRQSVTSDFLARFCGNLNLPYRVQKLARTIVTNAAALDLVPGRSPISIAAASILLACQMLQENCSANQIADVTGTSQITVQQVNCILLPHASSLVAS